MLDRARSAWARASSGTGSLTLIEHDLTTLDLAERFDLVMLALNSLLVLPGSAAQERALRVMRAHLAPGGRALVDVWLPTKDDLELYDGRQVLDWIRTDPDTNERIAKTTVARYDAATGTAQLSTTFDIAGDTGQSRSISRTDTITFITKDDLLVAAKRVGLEPVSVLGDYTGTAWSEASERVVLIARAR